MDEKWICFVNTYHKEQFRIPDGGYIQIEAPSGRLQIRQCGYIDPRSMCFEGYHTDIRNFFAGQEDKGNKLTPLAQPETIHGYMITDKSFIGDITVVLAHNPNAVQPYVTWQGHREHDGYDWGHYHTEESAAFIDYGLRSKAVRTGTPYTPYRPNRDDAR
jgi:hypothetical protein